MKNATENNEKLWRIDLEVESYGFEAWLETSAEPNDLENLLLKHPTVKIPVEYVLARSCYTSDNGEHVSTDCGKLVRLSNCNVLFYEYDGEIMEIHYLFNPEHADLIAWDIFRKYREHFNILYEYFDEFHEVADRAIFHKEPDPDPAYELAPPYELEKAA